MVLNCRVCSREIVYRAVEVHQRGVSVRECIVEDALQFLHGSSGGGGGVFGSGQHGLPFVETCLDGGAFCVKEALCGCDAEHVAVAAG